MKTSVTKIMMSFALMGCLIIGASDASAQGRGRSQGGSSSSRSHAAAVSRSNSSKATPQVSRSNSTPSVSRSSAPSVSRSSKATPQVNRSSMPSRMSTSESRGSVSRPSSTPSSSSRGDNKVSRGGNATTRGNDGHSGSIHGTVPRNASGADIKKVDSGSKTRTSLDDRNIGSTGTRQGVTGRPGGNRPGNGKGHEGMDNNRHGNGNKPGGNGGIHNGSNGRNGNDNAIHNDRRGNHSGNRHDGNHNGHKDGKPGNHGHNNRHVYGPDRHFDYGSHHYRDQFRWNYSHHSWSRPLPPPARAHRPAPLLWHRPVIPAGWRPYASAPVIDRILGLMFGSLWEASLDHLYYNGYYIDGYAENIIYLRDVPMLNLYWSDVMLNYELNRLANAQFIYHSSYYDRTRFDRVYNSLCRIYGPPVIDDGMTISWHGGNRTGWVTLTMSENYGDYYTTMSIGY